MSSEGVIKIKGDTADFDQKIGKSTEGMSKLGRATDQAVGRAKSFGEAWQHANGRLVQSVANGLAVAKALSMAAEAAKEFGDEAAKASRAVGDISISKGVLGRRLGLSGADTDELLGGIGTTTTEQRVKFAESLAGEKQIGRGRPRKLSREEMFQAQRLYNSGLYEASEINDALTSGTLGSMSLEAGFDALGAEGQAAYRAKVVEVSRGQEARGIRSQSGMGIRYADAERDVFRANNPVYSGIVNAAGRLPIIGGGVESVAVGIERALLGALTEQTQIMRDDAARPTVAPGAE